MSSSEKRCDIPKIIVLVIFLLACIMLIIEQEYGTELTSYNWRVRAGAWFFSIFAIFELLRTIRRCLK